MSKNDHDKSLSTLLSDWQVSPTTETHFRHEVWNRIGQRQKESAWPGYLRSHAATAVSLAIFATILGGVTGYSQARDQAQERREAMATAYVKSIDMSAQMAQR
jgi:hypothetical protein